MPRKRLDLLNTRPVFDVRRAQTYERAYEPRDFATEAASTAQTYSCLRSRVERFPTPGGRVGVRDGLARDRVYDTDRASIAYRQVDPARTRGKHSGSVTGGKSFEEIRRRRRAEAAAARRRKQAPRCQLLDRMADKLYETDTAHKGSLVRQLETKGNPATSMQSTIRRWTDEETPYTAPLGPGSYDTKKPPRTARARLEFSTVQVERRAAPPPEKGSERRGPGAYSAERPARHSPAPIISQVPRFKTKVEFFQTAQSNYTMARDAKQWERGIFFSKAPRKQAFGGKGNVATDFLPELDSGTKTSVATAVAKSPLTYRQSFASKTQRGIPPETGTPAQLGPGTFEPSAARAGIRVFAKGKPSLAFSQKTAGRVDPRVMADGFNSLRPRWLLVKSRMADFDARQ